MGILTMHAEMHREVFALPGMLKEPFLQIGYQIIAGKNPPVCIGVNRTDRICGR